MFQVMGNVAMVDILGVLKGSYVAADQSGKITAANQSAGRLLGWLPEELVGMPITAIIPARMRMAHREGFRHFLDSGESRLMGRAVRVPALGADGEERDVDLTILAFEDRDRKITIVAGLRAPQEAPLDLMDLETELKASQYHGLIAPGDGNVPA